MQPVNLVLASGPQSPLCLLCKSIFSELYTGWEPRGGYAKEDHFTLPEGQYSIAADSLEPDMLVIESSAKSGCPFCDLVWRTFSTRASDLQFFAENQLSAVEIARCFPHATLQLIRASTSAKFEITYYVHCHNEDISGNDKVWDTISIHLYDTVNYGDKAAQGQYNCDGCDERIRGLRHKCLQCVNYDYCADCFENPPSDHPNNHQFTTIIPNYEDVENQFRSLPPEPCEPSTASASTWNQCKSWIQECLSTHSKCNKPFAPNSFLPTRLIDVIHDPPRLCLSNTLPANAKYVTLSHCWGTMQITRLTDELLNQFLEELPISELPQTFQDAIDVVKRMAPDFGVQYLWIDSLCIIQAQPTLEDWLLEAPRMADVYGNAFCNIAATAAKDGRTGLFSERQTTSILPLYVRFKNFNGVGEDEFVDALCINPDRLKSNVDEAPLNRRAWVFQEKLLSARVLQFGRDEVFWACQCSTASESFPRGERMLELKWKPETTKSNHVRGLEEFGGDQDADSGLYQVWSILVEDYCKRQLSFPQDKLVAFSGIAQRLQPYFKNSRCIAGIWEHQLAKQLLWSIESPVLERVKAPASQYLAPSWSWASVEGSVKTEWAQWLFALPCLTLLEADTTIVPGHDIYGQVSAGFLQIKCKIFPGRVSTSKQHVITILTNVEVEFNSDYLYDLKDNDDDVNDEAHEVYCMPVVFKEESRTVTETCSGLVLRPTGKKKGQFRRVGTFSRDVLKELRPRKNPPLPRQSKIVVFGRGSRKNASASSHMSRGRNCSRFQDVDGYDQWYNSAEPLLANEVCNSVEECEKFLGNGEYIISII
ncbi:hypothetical protein BP6252_14113 [Coleophoma cylindrospora]|uniref:ZZ-type domain-containing protein n=1 Tax=Coleophoma cylindrospora TaxID=1849047 RepID=A0A3D8Q3X6_9HELO|nr:hypothetical protein BP6252_14113 [Coleophoma cylindrospora]